MPSPVGQPFLEEIDSATRAPANQWHTDVTFCDRPPAFTFLHGVVMPDVGGDTIWANTVAAYERLPKEQRDLADTLRIVNTNTHDYAKPSNRDEAANAVISAHRRQFVSTVFSTVASRPGLPGHPSHSLCGPTIAAIFVAEIADIGRFRNAEALTSWAGLAPRHRESDTKVIRGPITKSGSKLVRWAAIEPVSGRRGRTRLRADFDAIAARRGKSKPAVQWRKLLTLVSYGLRDGEIRCLTNDDAA